MPERTITALFASERDAEQARTDLSDAGITRGVTIHQNSSGTPSESGGFWAGLKEMFGSHEDTHAYAEGIRRGNYLLTVKVDDEAEHIKAVNVLEGSNAIDIDQAQAEWQGSGWAGTAAPAQTQATTYPGTSSPSTIDHGYADRGANTEEVIPVVAEELKVGKREYDRGGVRVRSYIVETPVSEQVSLREERVDVERRPVDRPTTQGEELFRDRSIELTETAEEAVVAKEAFVREEVVVRKTADERTQTINDKVRHTEVEVERTGAGIKEAAFDEPVR